MKRRVPGIVLALLLAGTAIGCAGGRAGNEGANVPHPYPAGCAAFDLSTRRCEAILRWALTQSGVEGRPIGGVDLLGDPGCGQGPNVICRRSTQFVVRVQIHFADGGSTDQSVFCGVGGQYSLLCTETPEIHLTGPTFGGYWDTTGATPPPIPPDVRAAARPLRVAALDFPIDHVGHYELSMGRAVVPLGILSRASVRLADPRSQAVSVSEDGVAFVIRSADPNAKPFLNLYERGWHGGTEEVVAVLVFDVTAFEPGAKLKLRDLVVE